MSSFLSILDCVTVIIYFYIVSFKIFVQLGLAISLKFSQEQDYGDVTVMTITVDNFPIAWINQYRSQTKQKMTQVYIN